ncbi:unnamed protein product [Closterium sp. NIES-54]
MASTRVLLQQDQLLQLQLQHSRQLGLEVPHSGAPPSRPGTFPPPPRVLPRQVCRRSLRSRPPPQRPVHVVSGGAGGAGVEGEGTVAAGAVGPGSGGARDVGVEAPPVEDTAASSRRPCPTSPPDFKSIPQFPPRSSLRSVAAEPGGGPAGGTGGTKGAAGGSSGSGGAGAGEVGTLEPTPRAVRFQTREQRLFGLEREDREKFERARQQQQQQQQQEHSQSQSQEKVEEEPQQQVQLRSQHERVEKESRLQQQVQLQPQQEGAEENSRL